MVTLGDMKKQVYLLNRSISGKERIGEEFRGCKSLHCEIV